MKVFLLNSLLVAAAVFSPAVTPSSYLAGLEAKGDYAVAISLALANADSGVKPAPAPVPDDAKCGLCKGTGKYRPANDPNIAESTCPRCDGSGKATTQEGPGYGQFRAAEKVLMQPTTKPPSITPVYVGCPGGVCPLPNRGVSQRVQTRGPVLNATHAVLPPYNGTYRSVGPVIYSEPAVVSDVVESVTYGEPVVVASEVTETVTYSEPVYSSSSVSYSYSEPATVYAARPVARSARAVGVTSRAAVRATARGVRATARVATAPVRLVVAWRRNARARHGR